MAFGEFSESPNVVDNDILKNSCYKQKQSETVYNIYDTTPSMSEDTRKESNRRLSSCPNCGSRDNLVISVEPKYLKNHRFFEKSHLYRRFLNNKTVSKYSTLRSMVLVLFLFIMIVSSVPEVNSSLAFDYVPHPEFVEKAVDLNVTSYIDQTTRLPCTIRHLGNKRVSWIRGRDLQVLSSGRTTFATDIRISILPGVNVNKKRYKKKRNVDQTHETFSYRSKRSFHRGTSFFSKMSSDEKWRQRHRLDHTSYLPSVYDGFNFENLNNTFVSKFSSGLNFPFKEVLSNANYNKLYGEATVVPSIVTTPQRGSISIRTSTSNATPMNSNRRTIIPYNYLDDIWDPEDFTLQIKYTKRADSGTYICQINTEPRVTQAITLKVVDMVAKIAGQKELFVKEGSPVVLICKVIYGKNLPGFIFWFKDNTLVDYDSSGGRIKVDTTPNGRSKLVLLKAQREDSSNYTCAPSGGKSDSIILTVIEDERPAAMQKEGSFSTVISCVNFITIFFQFLFVTSLAQLLSSVEPYRDTNR